MYSVPNYPSELGFQFSDNLWRPNQRNAIERILNSDKKLVVVDAPTGSGKSPIALSLGRVLADEGRKCIVATPRISLQEQYMAYEFTSGEQPTEATGRANHICIYPEVEPDTTAADAPCVEGFECPLAHAARAEDIPCSYYRDLRMAEEAAIRVFNYPFFFSHTQLGHFSGNDWLICDEGHNIDSELLKAAAVVLYPSDLNWLRGKGIDRPKVYQPLLSLSPQILKWAKETLGMVARRNMPSREQRIVDKLAGILRLADTTTVIEQKEGSIRFAPAIPEELAERMLTSRGSKLVLMSATIFDGNYWGRRLGYDPDDVEYVEIPSTFPVEARRVNYLPTAMMNHRTWGNEEEMGKLMAGIDWIITRMMPTKGLIHSVSFRLANYIKENSRYSSFMIVGGADKLPEFMESDVGIFVSPSAVEGLDLYDELCLAEDTRVLRKDMRWIPIQDICIGDVVIGIDEKQSSKYKYRAIREAEVTAVGSRKARVKKITTDKGSILATREHPFLVKQNRRTTTWVKAERLKVGWHLRWLAYPVDKNETYEAGWLSGFFDGEGCLSQWTDSNRSRLNISASQRVGPTLTLLKEYLSRSGFDWRASSTARKNPNWSATENVSISGNLSEKLRFLSEIRPERLIEKLSLGGMSGRDQFSAKVLSVEDVPEEVNVYNITTTTGTYFAEGFAVHNCRWVIFPKVPFLDLSDPVTRVQAEQIPEFYAQKAASQIVQGAGRGMRHAQDSCVSFILDKNFARLYHQTKGVLPRHFLEALSWYKELPWEA